MILREFDFDAPDLPRHTRSNFKYQVRTVCALFTRCFEKGFITSKYWKILINLLPDSRDIEIQADANTGIIEVGIKYDTAKFLESAEVDKKRIILELLIVGSEAICAKFNWSEKPFINAYHCVKGLNYNNEWVWKSKKSPQGKLRAEIFCVHEVSRFRIFLNIKDKKGFLITQFHLLDQEPDEHIFKNRLGKLEWLSNNYIQLIDVFDEEKWGVDISSYITED